MTHPHPNRKFVPQAVLTKSGKINIAGASVNIVVRPVNTTGSKPIGNLQQKEYKEEGVINSGCSRHMTGNKCYLTKFEDYDGGFVSFRDGKGRISSKVLLRVPRKDNIYSVDLKSVVPTKGLTCLFAKATIDESNLWHRRLGHINFKNMNKLMRRTLVRGLPSKIFENDHSCFACQKGNQHKASSKAKLVNSISKPLHMLHMDPFGPTNVKSLMKKSYCLVVTDDFNEAVNTACYVLNRVLVIKPHNKIPYELIRGRTPLIEFMKHFGCPVTILNTMDHLGNGPDWFFDVDSLSKSMNYVPVIAGNKTNGIAGKRDNIVTCQAKKKTEPEQEYILIPICITDPLISQDPKFERLLQQEKQTVHPNNTNSINIISTPVSAVGPSFTNDDPSSPVNAAKASNVFEERLFEIFSPFKNPFTLPHVSNVTPMENTRIFGNAYDDEDVGTEANLNNLETSLNVSHIPATIIEKDHLKDQIIGYFNLAIQTRRMTKISDKHAMIDVKNAFLYGTIAEEVYMCQPLGFEDPQFPNKVYKVEKAHQAPRTWYKTLSTYLIENGFRRGNIDKTLFIKKDKGDILLVHMYVDDIIFGSTKKSLCDEFEVKQKKDGIFISQDKYMADILKMFDFATMKTTSTPMEPNKALIKDEEADSVDVHLYRSMIGSLMYLTTSRLDITFAVCACVRFQVSPKMSHLHAVKRIFRYFKGKPKLGLWYPKDSPFNFEAFSDSDYAGASLDRKSTTGAEYVAAANCCGQVLWIQNQMLDYGFNFMNTKIFIDNESTTCIVKNPVFHSKTKHIEIRHHFIRDCYEKKLIQVIKIHTDHNVADLLTKAFDVSRFNFLIASIGLLNL
ncbi:putative ribonuclease H-like domain-containing protein [Tanacetum coccineum]